MLIEFRILEIYFMDPKTWFKLGFMSKILHALQNSCISQDFHKVQILELCQDLGISF